MRTDVGMSRQTASPRAFQRSSCRLIGEVRKVLKIIPHQRVRPALFLLRPAPRSPPPPPRPAKKPPAPPVAALSSPTTGTPSPPPPPAVPPPPRARARC